MRPSRGPVASLLAASFAVVLGGPAQAGGLRCSVGEVVIDHLKIGHTYSLRSLANLPLSLTSGCDGPVLVEVLPQIPETSELRQGAEAIPSLDWVSAEPETLALAPGQTRFADLTFRIPDDARLLGRKFQAVFWSHTLPLPGELLAFGLKSRIIFSIDSTRAGADEATPAGGLGVELTPAAIRLDGVAGGKPYRLATEKGLRVRNTSSRPVTVEISALKMATAGVPLEQDRSELLSAATLKLTPERLTLAPGESRAITGTIDFVLGAKVKGRELMCIVSATVVDQPVRTRIYSRIYARPR